MTTQMVKVDEKWWFVTREMESDTITGVLESFWLGSELLFFRNEAWKLQMGKKLEPSGFEGAVELQI